ncbi:protein mono-ADP-ribosyltransferase PARP12-like isoform X2 [Conger conger]|uniref:protein mono-ADP-ribosyltransferase PARP12-like isoform X2 n=1 Tax=Conger conger TaxID=82655 RepID=UPI002A5A11E7|nr:protein mono-ADP-ribosyltransferase PARP12-like isoform X2 [Conger conger]
MGDMSDLVSHFITKNLCKNQGCLDYGQLCQMISPICKDPDEMLFGVLTEKNRFVIVDGKGKTGCSVRPDSVVVAKTSLRVCQSLPGNCHRNCGNLHLCRYFVCGDCRYRNKCRNCHELDTEHNAAVLMRLGLQNLEPSELLLLLLQNDPYLLPEVCVHYNRADGLHGACQFKGECTNLHICRDFLLGACRADGCLRVHKFDPKAMKILSGRGVSPENRSFLFRIYRNRYLISSSMETPQKLSRRLSKKTRTRRDADRNSICLFFIRSECTYDEKCNNIHFHLPYKWQVLIQEGSTWTDLPNNEDIEKAYCNPENNTSLDQLPVNFCTMMCGSAKVRRLSTVSSANGGTCSITSKKLEVAFQDDIDGDILLSKGGQRYVLSFKGMYEVSIELQTRQEVRRRPCFLSALQVKKTLERETEEASSCSTV